MAWATIGKLEEHLGVPQDARMIEQLAVAIDWAQAQRPDLDPLVDPRPSITQAVILFAGLLYLGRATPGGLATYETVDGGDVEAFDAMAQVNRLLQPRRAVAR